MVWLGSSAPGTPKSEVDHRSHSHRRSQEGGTRPHSATVSAQRTRTFSYNADVRGATDTHSLKEEVDAQARAGAPDNEAGAPPRIGAESSHSQGSSTRLTALPFHTICPSPTSSAAAVRRQQSGAITDGRGTILLPSTSSVAARYQ